VKLKWLEKQFHEFAKKTKFSSCQTKHIRVFQDTPRPSPNPLNPQGPKSPRIASVDVLIPTTFQLQLPLKVGEAGGGGGRAWGALEFPCMFCLV